MQYGINEHSVLADGFGIGRCSSVTTVNNHNRVEEDHTGIDMVSSFLKY